jgi:3-hydroxypropanoate dehydrogenase
VRNIEEIFADRTCMKFLDKPVSKDMLVKIYDLMKMGSTSANACPLRIIFVQSNLEKEKLSKIVMEANIEKVKSAPVVALFAYDMKFYEKMNKLYPTGKFLQDYFASFKEDALIKEALRNSSLQAAYFMIIARSMGLDTGPMSGFDSDALNEMFFKDTDYRINFICNIGYRDGESPYPRLPRLDFEEACNIV